MSLIIDQFIKKYPYIIHGPYKSTESCIKCISFIAKNIYQQHVVSESEHIYICRDIWLLIEKIIPVEIHRQLTPVRDSIIEELCKICRICSIKKPTHKRRATSCFGWPSSHRKDNRERSKTL